MFYFWGSVKPISLRTMDLIKNIKAFETDPNKYYEENVLFFMNKF